MQARSHGFTLLSSLVLLDFSGTNVRFFAETNDCIATNVCFRRSTKCDGAADMETKMFGTFDLAYKTGDDWRRFHFGLTAARR
jgi:hypothetical protein